VTIHWRDYLPYTISQPICDDEVDAGISASCLGQVPVTHQANYTTDGGLGLHSTSVFFGASSLARHIQPIHDQLIVHVGCLGLDEEYGLLHPAMLD
jgi:hypothetical protein